MRAVAALPSERRLRVRKPMNESTDLRSALAPLWRRKLLILAAGVIAGAGAYLYYSHQQRLLSASTQIYFDAEEQAAAHNGASAARFVEGQAQLIGTALIGDAARARLSREGHGAAGNGKAQASAKANSELLTITAEGHSAKSAAELANAYAVAYIAVYTSGYRGRINAAIGRARRQVQMIEAAQRAAAASAAAAAARSGKPAGTSSSAGESETLQIAALNTKLSQLRSELGDTGVRQIGPANPSLAVLLAPRPRQDALFGFLLGLLLAALLVHMLARLDGRVQNIGDLERITGHPLLAALPHAGNPLPDADGSTLPAEALLEPLRRLNAALKRSARQHGEVFGADAGATAARPGTLLVIGAERGDGSSTAAAGLALVACEAGDDVRLVDADLRFPALADIFNLQPKAGIDAVLAGAVALEDALLDARGRWDSTAGQPEVRGATITAARSDFSGDLQLLVPSAPAQNPAALLGGQAMSALLAALAEHDGPVLLVGSSPVIWSDSLPLLGQVDAVLVVARIGHTHRQSLARLLELLAEPGTPPLLGVLANDVPPAEMRRRGLGDPVRAHRWRPQRLAQR